MQNSFNNAFWDLYCKLPSYAQKQADRAFERFALDTRYPSLDFKCVNKTEQQYSIRINRKGYRALGYMHGDTIIWDWIGVHDAYERRID